MTCSSLRVDQALDRALGVVCLCALHSCAVRFRGFCEVRQIAQFISDRGKREASGKGEEPSARFTVPFEVSIQIDVYQFALRQKYE